MGETVVLLHGLLMRRPALLPMAWRLRRRGFVPRLFGYSTLRVDPAVAIEALAALPAGVPVGMIAGSRPLGLGQFFGRFEGPSDGTVAVAETRLPGLAAHAVIPASHSGLIVSRVAAELAANFLATGAFPDGRAASPPV